MKKLSLVLATYNEEKNIAACLESAKDLADEMIVVDGSSTDKTVEIARSHGAKVIVTDNPPIFHINKQKALDAARNEWVLQLDADERVSERLAKEIEKVISLSDIELETYQESLPNKDLFLRHQHLLEKRDGKIGTSKGPYNAFFIPRLNFFLGRYLRYGGVYPDGVIRLVRRGKAKFPCRDVHEQIEVEGRVGWLARDLIHMADPTFRRYRQRNSRYTDLMARQYREEHLKKNFINTMKYMLLYPIGWFGLTYIRHKGFLDSWQGLAFSAYSSLRFPISYVKYLRGN